MDAATRCLCPLQSHRLRVHALTPCSPRCPSTALAPHPLLRDGGRASRDTSQPLATALPCPAPRCHSGGGHPLPPAGPGQWREREQTQQCQETARGQAAALRQRGSHTFLPAERGQSREAAGGGGLGGDSREMEPGHSRARFILSRLLGKMDSAPLPEACVPDTPLFLFPVFFFFSPSIQKSELRKERDRADIFLSVRGSALGRAGERQSG